MSFAVLFSGRSASHLSALCRPSTAALLEAMARFPSALLTLADLCGVVLPPRIAKHAYLAKPAAVAGNVPNILTTLFVERNSSLWKEAEGK